MKKFKKSKSSHGIKKRKKRLLIQSKVTFFNIALYFPY